MNELPDSILKSLADPDPAARLAAVSALRELPVTLPIVVALGRLAANDPDVSVRSAALAVLRGDAVRTFHSRQPLPRDTRQAMLQQIDRWQMAGLIQPDQAEVLRLRYGFDFYPAALPEAARQPLAERVQLWMEQSLITPEQAMRLAASLSPQPAAPGSVPAAPQAEKPLSPPGASAQPPDRPAAHAPSLSQILFSETSIRIALFLGGFLIVAAALILAALVEVARLPVLLGLAVTCGTGALVSRRRLPLPSLVLYMIFASLIPILARVLVDLLRLTGAASDSYWSAAWLLLALALAAGTRLYGSRLMSFAALGALVAAAFELAALLNPVLALDWRALGLLLALAAIIGALGAARFQRWKDARFALPVYLGSHLVAAAALLFNAFRIFVDLVESPEHEPVHWLFFAAAWAAGTAFYAICDRSVRRFALLPYMAVGALFFFPATLAQAFQPAPLEMAAIVAAWGAVCALGGAALDPRVKAETTGFLARCGKPLMFAAPALFAWAALLGLDEDVRPGLILLAISAAVLTALNVFRARPLAWLAALLFWLAAYFAFFELPVVKNLALHEAYVALAPGLLLLLPEFFPFSTENNNRWRVPSRWVGVVALAMVAFAAATLVFTSSAADQQDGALINTIMAIFLLALALRRGLPLVALTSTALLPCALVLLLLSLRVERWLPWLAGLAVVFYATGMLLRRGDRHAWSRVFRFPALALVVLFTFRLPFELGLPGGLAVGISGALFLVELLWGPRSKLAPWLEAPLDVVWIAALFGLLHPTAQRSEPLAWALGLLAAALIVLGLDLFFTRAPAGQRVGGPTALRWAARTAGLLLALGLLAYTITVDDLPAGGAAAVRAVSAAYALLAARAYPLPRLGYAAVGYLALALFYLLRVLDLEIWLAPEIALAALLYAGSVALDRAGKSLPDGHRADASVWAEVLRYGGLALALLVSMTAPFEDTGPWASLWVACAATLYAVEAFRRRSVWWGFPTDALYLLAYFLLLIDLHVDQAQYFSIAVAALGMLQHYLLIRTGSSLGAFITGMLSQLVLLGTTYYQMTTTEQLGYFVILFFQGLAVLVYGMILRSRSLVITPLVFIVVGVMTVVLSILSGVPTAIIIGCTGVLLLALGILAVLMRERLVEASEKMGGWRA